ncbi:hypothetical protein P691DRAFT_800434 [Macrolepiota fuliginosa MF-IS2]|uniref:Uncharacterized protein n=1 Tax=Macrolepiota fuliginosa MF-IS2 TaxID=1400762 RepID=A0A9P5XCV1_9AGAR|nr:hypothetical protein P691DRAFT_800434 [Macrolepiota fuliginosa MF-IS2]
MAGANYTGGRRNAAKARSRDKTGRIQKDFFGRRRLNILSKGLGVLPRSEEIVTGWSNCSVAARDSIELGHARKTILIQRDDKMLSSVSTPTSGLHGSKKRNRCLEIAVRVSPSSPCSGRSTAIASSSSIKSTKSKLLQKLDILEREFIIYRERGFYVRVYN